MKQSDIVKVYNTICNYKNREAKNHEGSLRFNHAIFLVQKAIEPHIEFQNEQQQKLYDEFKPEVDGDTFDFGTAERRIEFMNKMKDIGELDVNIDFDKPTIDLSENVSLDPDEIASLEPFVIFK